MSNRAEIFETHYRDYCRKISRLDLEQKKEILGIELDNGEAVIPFLNQTFRVSGRGIFDEAGNRAKYGICVILSKYLLLCPDQLHLSDGWLSFKDFKQTSHFTNVNFFSSDTEQVILKEYTGQLEALERAAESIGGVRYEGEMPYDLSFRFDLLPRVALLVLFNDRDDEFPAQVTVLFSGHAEHYLDPESLAMGSAALAKLLVGGGI